jgi:hypothetical protein
VEILGFSLLEIISVGTLVIGGIISVVKIVEGQKETKEDISKLEQRLDTTLEEIRKNGEERGRENKLSLQELKKETNERLSPLEHEVKINATYIASQGATLNSISNQLANMSTQLSTIITKMMDRY